MVCCCPEARLAEKKQDWLVLNRGWAASFLPPMCRAISRGCGASSQLCWVAAFPPMCREILRSCPLLNSAD
ncbi:hypothetical protein SLEP1_g49087 [Rubroshorea leprosula]|uniref:Uncharacterized protein n=1 Tax=Rubroshorea leprosula TaxID=152421 RepID=A0AAV5LVZ2_9ROSI|nr:hypothetical protein SLEP1_g49087 [Rubroshorea leprosula]